MTFPQPHPSASFVEAPQVATSSRGSAPISDVNSASPQEDEVSTRTKILWAAGPIFAVKGFHQATVRDICDAASVNIASIKYHFGDKQSLYRDTVLLARRMRAEEFPNPDRNQQSSPAEKLHQFVTSILNRTLLGANESWQDQLLMNEIQHPTETCEQLASEFFRPFMDHLIEVINEVAGHTLPRKLGIQLALNIVGQCMIYRFAPNARTLTLGDVFAAPTEDNGSEIDFAVEIEKLADLITHFSLGGIERAKGNVATSIDATIHDDDSKPS